LIAAKRLVKSVFEKVRRLEGHPESGRTPPELKGLVYREVVVKPCRIFYKLEGDNIFILHVMRQERELRKFFLGVK
jgi:toxin ParE1/3/4